MPGGANIFRPDKTPRKVISMSQEDFYNKQKMINIAHDRYQGILEQKKLIENASKNGSAITLV